MAYDNNLLGLQELCTREYEAVSAAIPQTQNLNYPAKLSRRGFVKKFALATVALACPSISFGASQPQKSTRPYGEAVYTKSPKQIYIIAQVHRNFRSGRYTARIQTEIYRIAERLILNEGIDLILGEGHFEHLEYHYRELLSTFLITQIGENNFNDIVNKLKNPTDADLEKILGDDSLIKESSEVIHGKQQLYTIDIDAFYLLILKYQQLNAQGADDEGLFNLGKRNLHLIDSNPDLIDHIWEFRTAKILQNIPRVVGYWLKDNPNMSESAIVILGLAHMDEIYRFLDKERIRVKQLQPNALNLDGASEETLRLLKRGMNEPLKLFEKGYGVTVMIPETLIKLAPKFLPKQSS